MSLSISLRLGVAVVLLLCVTTLQTSTAQQPTVDTVTWSNCEGQCTPNVTCPAATWTVGECLSDNNVFFCSPAGDFVYELSSGNGTCGGWKTVTAYNGSVCNGEGQTFACQGTAPMQPALPANLPTVGFHFYAATSGECNLQTFDGTYLTMTESCNVGGVPVDNYSIWLVKNPNGTISLSTWSSQSCVGTPPSQTITAFPGECIPAPGLSGETGKPIMIAFVEDYEYPSAAADEDFLLAEQ